MNTHDWNIDKHQKADFEKDLNCMIDCVKLQPQLGSFLDPSEPFVGFGSGPKMFLGLTYVDNQLWFWKYNLIFLFLIWQHLGPLLPFF